MYNNNNTYGYPSIADMLKYDHTVALCYGISGHFWFCFENDEDEAIYRDDFDENEILLKFCDADSTPTCNIYYFYNFSRVVDVVIESIGTQKVPVMVIRKKLCNELSLRDTLAKYFELFSTGNIVNECKELSDLLDKDHKNFGYGILGIYILDANGYYIKDFVSVYDPHQFTLGTCEKYNDNLATQSSYYWKNVNKECSSVDIPYDNTFSITVNSQFMNMLDRDVEDIEIELFHVKDSVNAERDKYYIDKMSDVYLKSGRTMDDYDFVFPVLKIRIDVLESKKNDIDGIFYESSLSDEDEYYRHGNLYDWEEDDWE